MRHYQIGFGHKIIPKKPKQQQARIGDKTRHRRAFSASIADQFTLADDDDVVVNRKQFQNANINDIIGSHGVKTNDATQTEVETQTTTATETTENEKGTEKDKKPKMRIDVSDADALMSAMNEKIGNEFNSKELSELSELLQFFAENNPNDENKQQSQSPNTSNLKSKMPNRNINPGINIGNTNVNSNSNSANINPATNAHRDALHHPHIAGTGYHDAQTANINDHGYSIDAILKLGGAFITNKKEIHSLRKDNIDIALKHIKECYDHYNKTRIKKQKNKFELILIHGAGSFGHFEAKKYNLMNGIYNEKSRFGFIETRNVVLTLHSYILNECINKYQLPIMSINTGNLISSSNGEISTKQFRPLIQQIKKCFDNGFIPLVHGDCIFDDKRGCSVVSGDTILEFLGYYFNPQRCIFWTNVDGVYNTVYETSQSKDKNVIKNSITGGINLKIKSEIIKEIHVDNKGFPILSKSVIQQLKSPKKFYQS